jgi:beta-galactosidase
MLKQYVLDEDPTRPVSAAANSAQPGSPFAAAMDAIGLNYQGSRPGRGTPNGSYGRFRETFPDKSSTAAKPLPPSARAANIPSPSLPATAS